MDEKEFTVAADAELARIEAAPETVLAMVGATFRPRLGQ